MASNRTSSVPATRIVTARHAGRCRWCGRPVRAGDLIVLGWWWRHLQEVSCRRPECCGIAEGLTAEDVRRIESGD